MELVDFSLIFRGIGGLFIDFSWNWWTFHVFFVELVAAGEKCAAETQFSLVNDTTADQKTFGEPNANLKTFGKSNATVKLRLAAAKCAFPRLLLVVCCC